MKTIPIALLSLVLLPLATLAETAPKTVVKFDHAQVENAFAKGQLLATNDSYKILAGRRVASGTAEIHERDTDIFYVLSGTITFVTGGTIVEGAPSGPGEIHGKSITGGTTHHLVKGDVITIPAGTPHQFTEVNDTFLYLVVKVTK